MAIPGALFAMHQVIASKNSAMQFIRRAALLAYRAGISWVEHRASTMGAAIAFYTLFSMGPVLLIAITVVGVFYDHDAARADLLQQIEVVLGSSAAQQVKEVIESVGLQQRGLWETLIGIVGSIFAATTVFAELKDSLDVIWETPKRKKGTLWAMIRRRLLSFGIVVSLGFILLASMLVSAAVSALITRYGTLLGDSAILVMLLNNAVTTLVVASLFGAIFKVLPDYHIPWHVVWQSALLTAVLYIIGKSLIAMYLGTTALASSYGAAGAVVLILVWMYYSAQVFLYGAELSRQMALEHVRDQPNATMGAQKVLSSRA